MTTRALRFLNPRERISRYGPYLRAAGRFLDPRVRIPQLIKSGARNDWDYSAPGVPSFGKRDYLVAVSYTHLTLPTICSV